MARRTRYDPRYYDEPTPEKCATTGKNIYPSAAAANDAAKLVKLDYGADVDIYRDSQCNHWHLTSRGQG